jgi:hypothetical protein
MLFRPFKQIDFIGFHFQFPQKEGAAGMIKFLAGSCLSGLGIVLKES